MFRATAFFRSSRIPTTIRPSSTTPPDRFRRHGPWQLSRGTGEACRQVEELLQFMPKYIPGYEQCALSFIAPVLGVRRQGAFWAVAVCRKRMCAQGQFQEIRLCACGYNVDIHHGRDEGSELYIVERGYGIPYGCMVPGQMDGGAVHRAADLCRPGGLWFQPGYGHLHGARRPRA